MLFSLRDTTHRFVQSGLRLRPEARDRHGLFIRFLACFLAASSLFFGGAPARAAQSLYQVEVIVFQYGTPGQAVTPATPAQVAGLNLSSAVNPAAEGSGIELVPASQMQLNGVEQRLKRAGDIPLVHIAWRQQRSESRAVRITSNELAPDGRPLVDGEVRLRVGQQLAISLDMLCLYNNQPIRLSANRTVKFGELHYFDHPVFGVLLQVVRATPGSE
jgi:hypothetical protein